MCVFGRRLVVALLGFAMISSVASAATINGRVRDSNNSYLLGATVTVRELDRSTSSVAGGTFSLSNVSAGTYTITVSSMGFKDATQTVMIAESGNVPLEVELQSEIVQLDKFVVEGAREGQARALQQKRSAANIMDAFLLLFFWQ